MTFASSSAPGIPRAAARGSIIFAFTAILSLIALHILHPDLDPTTSMISQYATMSNGWLMNLSFAAFAVGSLFLLIALALQSRSVISWMGLFCLLLAAVGLTFGALFNMDPVAADPSDMSFSGQMHGLAFMIGVPGELLAVLFLSFALRRAPWNGKALIAIAAFVWVSLIVMTVNLVGWMQAGATGPAIFGIPNRTFMIGYAVWLIVAAWPVAEASRRAGDA